MQREKEEVLKSCNQRGEKKICSRNVTELLDSTEGLVDICDSNIKMSPFMTLAFKRYIHIQLIQYGGRVD